MSSLTTHSTRACPGSSWRDGDLRLFQDEYLLPLSCEVIGNRAAHYTSTDNKYFSIGLAHDVTSLPAHKEIDRHTDTDKNNKEAHPFLINFTGIVGPAEATDDCADNHQK